MADIVWPASLPQKPASDGYMVTFANNLIRSSVDAGPSKVRRRFTATIDRMAMVFEMTRAQRDTFETFYKTTSKDGSKRFDFPHPDTEVIGEWRFVEVPEITYIAPDYYRVSLSLELMP